jgi:hypothetical protein
LAACAAWAAWAANARDSGKRTKEARMDDIAGLRSERK